MVRLRFAVLATVTLIAVLFAFTYSAHAETVGKFWAFQTSETGNTRFDTLDEAETELHDADDKFEPMKYTGVDLNTDTKINMQYAAEPLVVEPDNSIAWEYKACDLGLGGDFECGPGFPSPGPWSDVDSALGHLMTHGYYACGFAQEPAPITAWYYGAEPATAPTQTPALDNQERQVRKYQMQVRRSVPGAGQGDPGYCTLIETRDVQVYAFRDLSCPAQHPTEAGPDANGQQSCENNETAEISKDNNGYSNATQLCYGNPCDPATGAKYEMVTDYEAPGIKFTRTFRSNIVPWAQAAP